MNSVNSRNTYSVAGWDDRKGRLTGPLPESAPLIFLATIATWRRLLCSVATRRLPREFRQAPDRLRWEVYFALWNWNYTLCISRQPVCDGRARRGDTTLKERAI